MYPKDMNDMKILLKETDYAFSILMDGGGASNTDYADFTSNHFIKSFRHVLQRPDLSRDQLASMLRIAEKRRRHRDNGDQWGDVIQSMIAQGANTNNNTHIE